MNERRHCDRHQLLFSVRVYDADNGRELGYLSNVSEDGLMVISERPLRRDRHYRVRIPLPVDCEGVRELNADTTVAWTERAVHPCYHRNGLQSLALAGPQRRALQRLIQDYELRIAE